MKYANGKPTFSTPTLTLGTLPVYLLLWTLLWTISYSITSSITHFFSNPVSSPITQYGPPPQSQPQSPNSDQQPSVEELYGTIALLLKEQRILSGEFERALGEKSGLRVKIGGECACAAENGTQRRRGWRIKRKDGWGQDVETEVWL